MDLKYVFGPFTIDLSERCLQRSGRNMKLRPLLFDLLLYLVERAPRLIAKDELLAKVWKGDRDEWTITSTISELRKELGDDADAPIYIETAPKKGYRFICPVDTIGATSREVIIVEESIGSSHLAPDPLFDIHKQIDELRFAMGIMGVQIQELMALMKRSMAERKIERLTVIDILDEGEQAEFWFSLVKKANNNLTGATQNTWFERLAHEHNSLLATLDFYGKTDASASSELELAVSLGRFWDTQGYWSQGRERLRRALARQKPGASDLKAKGWAWLGFLSYCQGDYAEAQRELSESIRMSRQIDDQATLAFALHSMGWVAEGQGRYPEATALFLKSLKSSQKVQADLLMGQAFRGLGAVAQARGDHPAAKDFYLKSLRKREELQDLRGIAATLNNLGIVSIGQGLYAEARASQEESLALSQGGGNKCEMSNCYFNIGLAEEAGGHSKSAKSYFRQSLGLRLEVGDKRGVAKVMEALGRIAAKKGREKEAARMLGAADALRVSIAAPLSPSEKKDYGQIITSVRTRFPLEWKDGSQRGYEEVLDD